MNIIRLVKTYFRHIKNTAKAIHGINHELVNQSMLINHKLTELTNTLDGFIKAQEKNKEVVANGDLRVNDAYQGPPQSDRGQLSYFEEYVENLQKLENDPALFFAPKTYNTSHSSYDAGLVRNFPNQVLNIQSSSNNPLYKEFKKLMRKDKIDGSKWKSILEELLEEIKTIPHSEQVFERKAYVENYLQDLQNKYQATYNPGWVNLNDALFLYWVVRHLKPKTIVQTGVCNGLSSAFMMLALVKNGSEGKLHVVDMPPIFDSNCPNWKIKGKLYGVTIPEGKTSGWLVPDKYRDRFEVLNGNAKELLPPLLEKVKAIDMFYHDSDHTYDHMMFEFIEAKKYLKDDGVIVSDDISWNASLWDFADQYNVPSYNYQGSMGVAFF